MRILFVCLGNICRSPLLEAVLRQQAAAHGLDWQIASAGTGDWHIGEPADPRAIAVAEAHGYALAAHRARQLRADDFHAYDVLLAADRANLAALTARAGHGAAARLGLALTEAGLAAPQEIPDPYTGGIGDFRHVLNLSEQVAAGLIQRWRTRHT